MKFSTIGNLYTIFSRELDFKLGSILQFTPYDPISTSYSIHHQSGSPQEYSTSESPSSV